MGSDEKDPTDYEVLDQMKWTRPSSGTSKATSAGRILSGHKQPTAHLSRADAFVVASNWRSSHGLPLQRMTMTLRYRARGIADNSLIAQRLNRMPSIIAKLQRFAPKMKLSQMQDLGGCRAVMEDVEQVDALVALYDNGGRLQAFDFQEKYDYVSEPKADGYRGVHFVFRYKTDHEDRSIYNGLRIEIQIRSQMQHAWATAVETVDVCTHQSIKSGLGDDQWRRFFLLSGSFIAMMEKRPFPPGIAAESGASLKWMDELAILIESLNVRNTLQGVSHGMQMIASGGAKEPFYVLVLDSEKKQTSAAPFKSEEEAAVAYMQIEHETAGSPHIQAVLVSVDSLDALRSAYPNFYLDTAAFVGILDAIATSMPGIRARSQGEGV